MRIVQVSTWETPCGIAHYTASLRAGLEAAGATVDVAAIDRAAARYLPRRELRAHFTALAHRVGDADVVHIQHEFGFFAGRYGYGTSVREFGRFLRTLMRDGRQVFVTFHTDPLAFLQRTTEPLELATFGAWTAAWRTTIPRLFNRRGGARAVVHTRTARAGLIDSGVAPEAITHIPHGIPLEPQPAPGAREATRERLGLDDDDVLLGVFGFLAGYKGHMTAVRALDRLPERYRLLFVGGQHPESTDSTLEAVLGYMEDFPSTSDGAGVAERLTITGYQSDERAAAWLAGCDLLLAPYAPGTTVMASGALGRCLASGRPVIASAIPSFVELDHEAGCLALVTPGAPHELALSVERLMDDDAERTRLVGAATRYAEAHSWSAVAARHLAMYAGDEALPVAPVRQARTVPSDRDVLLEPREPAAPDDPEDEAEPVVGPQLRVSEIGRGRELTFVIDPSLHADPLVDHLAAHGFADDPPNMIVRHLMGPGRRFLDVGAHVGTFSLPVAADGGDVISVEASRMSVRLLRSAVELNGLGDRCRVVHAVAAERSGGVARFAANGLFGSVARNGTDGPVDEVPTVALDDVVADAGWPAVDVVKLDIEGYELHALAGMEAILAGTATVLVVECNGSWLGRHGATTRDLRARLEDLGLKLHMITRTEPYRLVPVTAGDVQTEDVIDLVCWHEEPAGLHPWYVAGPFGVDEVATRLAAAAAQPAPGYRAYAALALLSAPVEVRDHPVAAEALLALTQDPDEEVRCAARGATPPAERGVPDLAAPGRR